MTSLTVVSYLGTCSPLKNAQLELFNGGVLLRQLLSPEERTVKLVIPTEA
jgi:hypothetical protein